MKQSCRDLLEQGQKAFQRKLPVDSLHQEIAENFYPERATFTSPHVFGAEFATHLYSSFPLLMRRELGDMFSSSSRPQGENWFYMGLLDEDREDYDAKSWMEHKVKIMRRVMYDPVSGFSRTMKAADHDWVTFGQCAISVEFYRRINTLIYRGWHLRDMAWDVGYTGAPELIYRKWKPSILQLTQIFGKESLHRSLLQERDKHKEINVMHIFVPSECYEDYGQSRFPYMSFFLDVDNEHVIEEKGLPYKYYVIPRWFVPTDSQYAYSPAVIAGLPDARLYQDMTRVLLEAGQKAVDPPLIGQAGMIKSDIDLQAGGVTLVDAEYDERLGQSLRPFQVDKSGLPLGLQMHDNLQAMLSRALYIDKLNLPRNVEMTAYETSIRFQEYVRTILPLFEPKEAEMEAGVCQLTFDILFRHGAFGSVRDIPEALQGADYQFKFISPLSKAIEEKKTNVFMEVANILGTAAQIDQLAIANLDINKATREAIIGTGADTDWLTKEEDALAAQNQARQQQQAEQGMALTQQAKELMGEQNAA